MKRLNQCVTMNEKPGEVATVGRGSYCGSWRCVNIIFAVNLLH